MDCSPCQWSGHTYTQFDNRRVSIAVSNSNIHTHAPRIWVSLLVWVELGWTPMENWIGFISSDLERRIFGGWWLGWVRASIWVMLGGPPHDIHTGLEQQKSQFVYLFLLDFNLTSTCCRLMNLMMIEFLPSLFLHHHFVDFTWHSFA